MFIGLMAFIVYVVVPNIVFVGFLPEISVGQESKNLIPLKPSPKNRLLAFLPYLMPLLDGVVYGRFVFAKYPVISAFIFYPLQPLLIVYRGIPFLAFVLFAMLFYFIVRNETVDNFIRFNTMQAILIDLVLIIPQMFLHATSASGAIPPGVVESLCSLVFCAIVVITMYVIICVARGNKPDQVPLISEASQAQLNRFF
ncbi:Protein TIC 20-v, chloroplastic [Galdieria sulphuraria]|nr:Protein TIC 20-v, chloroplastic [Galdieria sulphuraria]